MDVLENISHYLAQQALVHQKQSETEAALRSLLAQSIPPAAAPESPPRPFEKPL